MDANQMAYQFNVLLDRVTSFDSPGYSDQEISIFLTKAQEVYLKDKFRINQGFEKNSRRIQEIKELKKFYSTSTFSSNTVGRQNTYFVNLPNDLRYPLDAELIVDSEDGCLQDTPVRVKAILENNYAIQKNNPFKNPRVEGTADDFVWELYSFSNPSQQVELIIPSGIIPKTYKLWYIKIPNAIVPKTGDGTTTQQKDCELNESVHDELVDIAIRIASASILPNEYQIKLAEEKNNN